MRTHGLLVICVLGLLCISAKGQATSSDGGVRSTPNNQITGKVFAANGKAARGAIVILRDVVTGEKKIAKADKQGKYLFAEVFHGEYSLSAGFNGKESETQNISLKHREQLQKDLKIKK